MTIIMLHAGWVVLLMGHAAVVPQRTACFTWRAVSPNGLEWRPKHSPLAHAVSGMAYGSSGRVVLGLGQISCDAYWPIWPGPKVQDYSDFGPVKSEVHSKMRGVQQLRAMFSGVEYCS
jgi:hypothetical protein